MGKLIHTFTLAAAFVFFASTPATAKRGPAGRIEPNCRLDGRYEWVNTGVDKMGRPVGECRLSLDDGISFEKMIAPDACCKLSPAKNAMPSNRTSVSEGADSETQQDSIAPIAN